MDSVKHLNYKLELEKMAQGSTWVIGCDEAGRGCLAGPIVAAAVILDINTPQPWYKDINDSKLLTPVKRFTLEKLLRKHAIAYGIGAVSPAVIDKINIHQANLLAMKRAVQSLSKKLGTKISHGTLHLVVDGRFIVPGLEISQQAVVRGDSTVLSIAAASVLAKAYRDRLMMRLAKKLPEYGFEVHKGYATLAHRKALKAYGLAVVHRRSFCRV